MFDTTGFVSRLHCGTSWTSTLIVLDIAANLLIITGYILISLQLYRLYRYRDVDYFQNTLTKLFIIFPLFCGLSRVSSIIVYWWAPYRFYITLNYLCAFSVLMLAFGLRKALTILFKLPSLADQINLNRVLESEIKIRKSAQNELQTANNKLLSLVGQLETLLQNQVWIHDRQRAIAELNALLHDLSPKNG